MAEPPTPAAGKSVQRYLGNQEFLRAATHSPITLANWFTDGSLVFAAEDVDPGQRGLGLAQGYAKSYQRQFEQSPELVAALDKVFRSGKAISETVRIGGAPWDARLFPASTDGRRAGVVGIFVDARDRITAFRAVSAIELLSQIRHHLARSDGLEEFLGHCCDAIGELHPSVWIGLADHDEDKKLQVVTGAREASRRFTELNLSWDVTRKGGRHPAAEAVTKSRIQVLRSVTDCSDQDMWSDADGLWTSMAAVPLLSKGTSLGVLVVHSEDESDFDAEMRGLWEKIANEIAEGIELIRSRQERARMMRERQGAYEQYRQLLDTIFDIVVVHRGGRIIEINPAGVKIFAAATSDQLIGTNVLALISPEDRKRMQDAFRDNNDASQLREFRLIALDGRSIDVEGLSVSICHEGAPARLSHWRDISDRKRAEKMILAQKMSLEYAQQLVLCGSVEIEALSGDTEWSRNALAILGLPSDPQGQRFVDAMSSLIVEQDRDELIRFIESIRQHAREESCEVTLRSEDASAARTIHIHGIPQTEQHLRVPRIFIVVQDISQYRNAERQLNAKLLATRKLARVVEWTYDIEKRIITWDGVIRDFLGFDSPVSHLTYEQFMASIRPEDRELVRRSIEHSFKHGSDGEMVYEETFDQGLKLLLYGRWRPERNAAGRIVKLKGLSLDITKIRTTHEREARKERIHLQSGLPEKAMVSDYVHHFASRARKFCEPFSIVGVRILEYPELKAHMANDALYYQTQGDIAHSIAESIGDVRTFGRLGLGCFAAVLSRPASQDDADAVGRVVVQGWQSALKQCETCVLETIDVQTCTVNCPMDGTEWEGLLALLDKNLTA